MANDAMLLSVDEIRFTSNDGFRKRFYLVGIVADNLGKVVVTEPPSSTIVSHKPNRSRSGIWNFPGDGYSLYHRTGGLPDLLVWHVLIVRDRSAKRRAGKTIQEIVNSSVAKDTIKEVSTNILNPTQSLALTLINPALNLIGRLLGKKNDKIVWTLSGSLVLNQKRRQQSVISETIGLPSGDLELDMDYFLFDAQADKDTLAETKDTENQLRKDKLLFSVGC